MVALPPCPHEYRGRVISEEGVETPGLTTRTTIGRSTLRATGDGTWRSPAWTCARCTLAARCCSRSDYVACGPTAPDQALKAACPVAWNQSPNGVAARRLLHFVVDASARAALWPRSPWTTCERVVGPGADDRNHWTKRARVAPRLGLLLVVPSERPTRLTGDDRYLGKQQRAGRSASPVRTAHLHGSEQRRGCCSFAIGVAGRPSRQSVLRRLSASSTSARAELPAAMVSCWISR
jgi:hypothetical protein